MIKIKERSCGKENQKDIIIQAIRYKSNHMNGELFFEQAKFLEPHLVVRICDFYIQHKTFDEKWILKEKIAALLKTRMYDQLKNEVLKLKDHTFADLDSCK